MVHSRLPGTRPLRDLYIFVLSAYNMYPERGEATGTLLDSAASRFKFSIIIPGSATAAVRDIHEAYKTDRDMICGTHEVYMSSLELGEAIFVVRSRAASCMTDGNFLNFDHATAHGSPEIQI